jgi:hypothetical protein
MLKKMFRIFKKEKETKNQKKTLEQKNREKQKKRMKKGKKKCCHVNVPAQHRTHAGGGYSVCGHQVVCHRLTSVFLHCNHSAVPQVYGVSH